MNPISVAFDLDWREYHAAERYYQSKLTWFLPEHFLGTLLVLTAIVLWYLQFPIGYPLVMVFIGALYFLTTFFRKMGLRQRWKREPIIQARHFIDFRDDGIFYSLNEIDSILSWQYYQKWLETPTGFMLFYSEDVFSFIPKSAFTSPESMDSFRQLLLKKLRHNLGSPNSNSQ